MSAIARRKQLEQELAEAQYALQDTYYNRSVEDKQTALDQELESFQEEKEAEIEKWEEYMDNIEAIVAESLGIVQENAEAIGQTLTEKAEEYNLTVSDAILSPWEDGSLAVSDYQDRFDTAMSSTMDQLEALKSKWQEVIDKMVEASKVNMDAIDQENANYAAAEKQEPKKEDAAPKEENKETQKPSLATGSYVEVKPGTRWYADSYGGGSSGNARSGKIKYINNSGSHHYNIDGLGWIKKQDIKGYKHGTSGVEKDQFAIVDEDQLEELVLGVENGRLTYLSKGSSVIPADLTSNLMSWGALDPQDMLDRNRPTIMPSKHIVNTEIQLDCSVGTLVNIEHCDQNTLPDVERLVNKAFEKHMQNLNNSIKKFTR